MTTLLGMFAKFWNPGAVKTRLAATLGPDKAAAIHRLFVKTLAARFEQCGDQRAIVFAPAASEMAFRAFAGDRWQLMVQTEGDLGQRMRAFFEHWLCQYERVVLIGSDSPDLPLAFLDQAFAALQTHEVVLGQAHDGGYYLVGVARSMPPIFADIAWGTGRVWPQTVERLQAAGVDWRPFPIWFDVDDEAGLQALLARLQDARCRDPHLAQLNDRLLGLLSETRPV